MATPKKKRTASGRPPQTTPAPASAAPAPGGFVHAGMDVYDKVVWFCLHALVILVPIAMSNLTFLGIGGGLPLTYDQFDIAKIFTMRAITIIALAAWTWKLLMTGGRVRRTKVDWLIVAFLAWVLLSTVFSISPATAFWGKYRRFEGMLSFMNYAAVFFLVVQMVDRPSRIRSLARSLFIGGVLVALYGLMQAVGVDMVKWGNLPFEANRSFSTYGNPDLLGGYLMFPLPIALGLALSEERALMRFLYSMGFVVVFACWITAFVRGAWIGGTVSLLLLIGFAVWLAMKGEVRLEWVDAASAALLAAFGGAFIFRSLRSTNEVMNIGVRLRSIFEFGQGSARTRFEIWEAAWGAIKARPLTGWGADTFRLVFPKFKPLAYTKDAGYLSVADNVHDYPLQLASGIGIPGLLLLYVGVFGFVLVVSIIGILSKATGPTRYLMLAVWAACVGYITHLFFGLSVTGSTLILWFCFGLLMSPYATSTEVEAPSWGSFAAVGLLAVLGLMFVYNGVYMVADNHYLRSRISQTGVARINEVKAAISLNPWNDMYRAELGLAYQDGMVSLLQQAQSQQDATTRQQAMEQSRSMFLEAEAALKDTIDFVPSEYDNYVFLANLYNQGGAYFDRSYLDKSIELCKKAVADVEPYGPAIRFQLGLAYQYKGETDNAIKTLEAASAQDPAYGDPKILLGQIYQGKGDVKSAKRWYESAISSSAPDSYQSQRAKEALKAIEASATSASVPAT